MIEASELRKGVTFSFEGNIYVVVEFMHVKPGKGAAFVRVKMKNIVTGQNLERTFNPGDKVEQAVIEYKEMQYIYNDGGLYYFMNLETFDQIPLNKEQIEDTLPYLLENSMVKIKFYKGEAFSVEPTTFVELEIVDCEAAVKGDTAKSGGKGKNATLETGLIIQVPLFVNSGEKIRVDTRTGEYVDRV